MKKNISMIQYKKHIDSSSWQIILINKVIIKIPQIIVTLHLYHKTKQYPKQMYGSRHDKPRSPSSAAT